jgi:hypothetical protein
VPGHEGSSGEIKADSEFKSVNAESGSRGVGSCEAKSELHGTGHLFSRFSGVVKSVSKVIFAYILPIKGSGILNASGHTNLLGPKLSTVKE